MKPSTLPQASDYHRRPIKVLNAVWAQLNRLGIANIQLDERSLIAEAARQTGLSDYGNEDFLVPMRILLDALETEADLNPVGRYMNRASIVRILKHRLYVQDLLQRHPEILERQLPDPVVVVGLARSGTTRLHRLLAADERFLHLKAWETVNPVPYPESYTTTPDPRITGIEKGLKAVLYMGPQIASVHPLGAHEVEEEVGLLQHSFSSQLFEIQAKIPSFSQWLITHDQTAAYEYMVTLLKVISWYRDDPVDKPWVLKTPQHMQDLDALIKVFPNAKLICSHRDPIKAVGSACSMTWNAIVRDSASVTADWVGSEWMDKTEQMLLKTQGVRENLVPAENQYDVLYADIGADWEQAITGIYDFLGMGFTPQAHSGMEDWLAANQQHKHGAHKYSLAEFGLNPETVDQRLMFYREKYAIPYESHNPNLTTS
ncbi:MAG: sulfotransferase [Halioglobus sp.]